MPLTYLNEDDFKTEELLNQYTSESLTGFIPIVRVEESGSTITVAGIKARLLELSIKNHWNTSKVYNNILTGDGWGYIKFNRWFAVEVAYMLTKLIEAGGVRSSVSELKLILNKLYTNTWLKGTKEKKSLNFDYSRLDELNVNLFDYQMAYLKSFEEVVPTYGLKGYLAEAEAGSGKTLQGYALSLVTEADLTIFIVPRPTVDQVWKGTVDKFFKRPKKVWDSLTGGTITGNEDYIIAHHHHSVLELLISNAAKIKRAGKILIHIDESHKFTTDESKLVQALYELIDKVNPMYVIHASATPLKAQPKEAIPLLKTIDPMFNKHVEKRYKGVFGSSKAVALDILNHRLGIVKFKVTKEQYSKIEETEKSLTISFKGMDRYTLSNVRDVMLEKAQEYTAEYLESKAGIIADFNKLHMQVVNSVNDQQDRDTLKRYKKYADKMHDKFSQMDDIEILRECKRIEERYHYAILKGEDRREFKRLAPLYKYPILSIRGRLLGSVLGRMRIECFAEMAGAIDYSGINQESAKKVLVFSSYVDAVKAARDKAVEQKMEPLIVTQETNNDLKNILERAENDPRANPIVATYQSLGTGNELVMCSTAVFVDLPFRDYVLHQAKFRINRASQDTNVTYVTALLDTGDEPNLSTRNLDILSWSKEQVNSMLGIDGDDIENPDEDLNEEEMKGLT